MNDMITKTQLKAGKPFTYKSRKYIIKGEEGEYYITDFVNYVGNINKIGTRSLTVYTYVMGKKVNVKVNYIDCEVIYNK
jgi:hypothetical protein